jgi:hypothetical protein
MEAHAGATLVGFAIGGRIRSEVDWTGQGVSRNA